MTPIDITIPPSGTGCVECELDGSWWVHLRRCVACGHVGCCDDSLPRHARAHASAAGHPLIQTFEPDEEWFWNYTTAEFVDGPTLAPPGSRPRNQPAPGPADRLETSVPGSFAAGDVRHNSIKRVASAVGEGAMAVTFAHRFLADTAQAHQGAQS